tara:strand:+ start:988 stop:1170 length:183 start_codon:yes stop_codon:yes gene_type:complete
MYKQYKGGMDDSVITDMIMQIKDADGNSITPRFIPFDEANTDYQAYLLWVAEGNTAEAAD